MKTLEKDMEFQTCINCPNHHYCEGQKFLGKCNGMEFIKQLHSISKDMLRICKIPPPPQYESSYTEEELRKGLKSVAPDVLDNFHALQKEFANRGWKLKFPNTPVPIGSLLPPPPGWTPEAKLVDDSDPGPIYEEFISLKERFEKRGFLLPEPECQLVPPV